MELEQSYLSVLGARSEQCGLEGEENMSVMNMHCTLHTLDPAHEVNAYNTLTMYSTSTALFSGEIETDCNNNN